MKKLSKVFMVVMALFTIVPIMSVKAATHDIVVDNHGHGTVTVPTTAEGGSVVTVNLKADAGYRINDILIKNSTTDDQILYNTNGNLIKTEDTYSFTMPEGDVKISVIFAPKLIYVDNTKDSSKSYVTGELVLKDLKTGSVTTTTVYSKVFNVSYSNTKTLDVQNAINEAYDIAQNKAKAYTSNVKMSTEEINGTVWDNRKYTSNQDGDAILIGDADYITGVIGNSNYVITFMAEGDYGMETTYKVVAYAEYTSEEEYTILNGANSSYTLNSSDGLTIRANGNIDNFIELKVDGKTLDTSYYTVKSGSTIATLKSSYLNTLSTGNHTLTFVYNDGEVTTNFSVNKENSNNPKTADNIQVWFLLLTVSFIGIYKSKLIKNN